MSSDVQAATIAAILAARPPDGVRAWLALLIAAAALEGACAGAAPAVQGGPPANGHAPGDARTATAAEHLAARCADVARSLAEAQLLALPPLPQGCPVESVLHAIPTFTDEDSEGRLGRAWRRGWRIAKTGVAGDAFLLWYDTDDDTDATTIVALELDAPRLTEPWLAIRDRLGPPEAVFDYYDGIITKEGDLWVYATRGFALYMAYDEDPPMRVVIFPPTTTKEFWELLAMDTEPDREEGFYR